MHRDALRDYVIKPVVHEYGVRDVILFALALGYGGDPGDHSQLKFVYEKGLRTIPAICNVLAHPGFWITDPSLGIDFLRVLHGEQSFEIHSPIPVRGRVRGEFAIVAAEDKGPDKGTVLHLLKRLYDGDRGTLLATVRTVILMRGDGGAGGFGTVPEVLEPIPDREPDLVHDRPTLPQAALIYRLNGDYNPIHVDPAAAKEGGLQRPILHGLCTMGMASRALIDTVAGGEPERLKSQASRFSRMVYPGETIRTEIYTGTDQVRYRCRVLERDLVVIDRGTAQISA